MLNILILLKSMGLTLSSPGLLDRVIITTRIYAGIDILAVLKNYRQFPDFSEARGWENFKLCEAI